MTREDYCPTDPSFGHKWRVQPGDYDGTQDLECRDCGAKKPRVNSSDKVMDFTLDRAVQSFKSWCQGGEGIDELEFKEYITDKYTEVKVLEERINDLKEIEKGFEACDTLFDYGIFNGLVIKRISNLQAELSKLKEE